MSTPVVCQHMSWRFGDASRKLTQRFTSRQIARPKSRSVTMIEPQLVPQLVPGDVVLMKNDAFQGKWKVKDWWSETEYVVVRQVTDGIPAYEVKDEAGSIKTIHSN